MFYDALKNPAALIAANPGRYGVRGVGIVRDGDRVWLASTEGHAMILVDASYDATDLAALEEEKGAPVLDPGVLETAKGAIRKKKGARVSLSLANGSCTTVHKSGSPVSFQNMEARFPCVLDCVPQKIEGTKVTLGIDVDLLHKLANGLGESRLELTLDVDADGVVRMPAVCRPIVQLRESAEDASFGVIMPVAADKKKK